MGSAGCLSSAGSWRLAVGATVPGVAFSRVNVTVGESGRVGNFSFVLTSMPFEDVTFSVALNTVDFVGNENVTFRYYDHLVASVSPFGGHLQGSTVVVGFPLIVMRLERTRAVACKTRSPQPSHLKLDSPSRRRPNVSEVH